MVIIEHHHFGFIVSIDSFKKQANKRINKMNDDDFYEDPDSMSDDDYDDDDWDYGE